MGYETFDADRDGYASHFNITSGEDVGVAIPDEVRTKEWRDLHEWRMSAKKIEDIIHSSQAPVQFFCGSGNVDEILHLFDGVFALVASDKTIKNRITSRTDNSFGKLEHELNMILGWNQDSVAHYTRMGAVIVDGEQPLSEVVESILGSDLIKNPPAD